MTKRPLLLLALVPAALVGGCMGTTANNGVESVHQPVVDRADFLLDLQLAGSGLAAGEPQRLAGWLDGMRVGYGDRVAIDDAGDAGAAREDIGELVAGHGLLLADQPPITRGPVAPGTIRVVVSRMRAGVPGCPDWTHSPATTLGAATSPNYGCGVNRNLAAMVARPEDLVHGSGGGAYDAATSYRAIESYRKATPTGSGGTAVKADAAGGK